MIQKSRVMWAAAVQCSTRSETTTHTYDAPLLNTDRRRYGLVVDGDTPRVVKRWHGVVVHVASGTSSHLQRSRNQRFRYVFPYNQSVYVVRASGL